MRTLITLTKSTLFALAAATVAASASAAAVDIFLTLGPVKGSSVSGKIREAAARSATGKQVEVMSWSWGASRKGWDGTVEGSTVAASDKPIAADFDGDGRADINVPGGDVNGDGRSSAGAAEYDGDGRADRVQAPRDVASGMPTGKRQHGYTPPMRPRGPGSGPCSANFLPASSALPMTTQRSGSRDSPTR